MLVFLFSLRVCRCMCVRVCLCCIVDLLLFFYTFFFPGQAPYTHWVQRHATLALLFAFYSWLGWQAWCHPGSAAVGECTLCLRHVQPCVVVTLPRWHQCKGRVRRGLVQRASNGVIKAAQQGSVAHAEMGGKRTGKVKGQWGMGRVQNGRCGV